MKTLLLVLQLFPAILTAVKAAEEAIPLGGQGKAKLDLVLDTVKSVYDQTGDLQKDFSWEKLAAALIVIIGKIVGTLNALGIFRRSEPQPSHA